MIAKRLPLILLSFLSIPLFAQTNPHMNSDIKVSADVAAGCFLSANNINFGVLMMPLTDNSASANMTIHCSKNTPLIIDVVYGDISTSTSTSSSSSGNTTTGLEYYSESTGGTAYWYYVNNQNVGYIWCYTDGKVVTSVNSSFNPPSCVTNGRNSGTYPVGWTGEYNQRGIQGDVNNVTIGSMTGVSHSEQIKYSLEIPSDSSKIWSKGFNSYNINAAGVEQTIPMKAHIKRADNPTHRMIPDNYQSTLSVILSY